jgi:hypothetical protein
MTYIIMVAKLEGWVAKLEDWVHCNENPIYVFLFWELRGLSLNLHIHVSVSDLYIPRIRPHISLQQNMQIHLGNV